MKKSFRNNTLVFLSLLLLAGFATSCANPFDPLGVSDEIRGLAFVDFELTWGRWDADPEGDGVIIELQYFNEFGEELKFHDKPHEVIVEFYSIDLLESVTVTQDPTGNPLETPEELDPVPQFDSLFFTFSVQQENFDNEIRIPIEAYIDEMVAAGYILDIPAIGFVLIRVRPPKAVPQEELLAFQANEKKTIIYEPEETAAEEEELADGAP